jgi:thermitase
MAFRRTAGALLTATASLALCASASAAAPFDDDSIIVKFEPGTPAGVQSAALDRVRGVGKTIGTVEGVDANVVSVQRNPARVADQLERNPNVVYAEPNFLLSTQATPNDPLFPDEYGLHNTGQTGGTADADIDAPEGWDAAGLAGFPNAGGVKVGIVDTGISNVHPDLAGKVAACGTSYQAGLVPVIEGVCEDDNGHGTHVAGTIAANTNNGQGVAGVAFGSQLVICKALATAAGTGLTSDIANCLNWTAEQGVRVINMSLGGGANETLKRAVANAWDGGNGALLVAAAGNDGDGTLNYPAAYPEAVSVAATDDDDRRASFSNANSDVEVAAPGDAITSTFIGTTYFDLSGTSMASPHAAGVAAVIAQLDPAASAATLRSRLTAAVDDIGAAGRDQVFGFGRVNLCKAAGGSCAYTAGG